MDALRRAVPDVLEPFMCEPEVGTRGRIVADAEHLRTTRELEPPRRAPELRVEVTEDHPVVVVHRNRELL